MRTRLLSVWAFDRKKFFMIAIYTITMFVSATMLFLVQPMFAKMILPLLGGTPAVWNTCMVFYQAVLLVGYVYAHVATRWLGTRRQAMLHIGLLFVPLLILPIAVPSHWSPPAESNPVGAILLLLLVSVGMPFFVVSASAPMLQRWFADTGHPSAKDPYFLYAASNLGSMFALLGYPLLFEPNLTLPTQSWVWTGGYALFAVLVLGCAVALWCAQMKVPTNTHRNEPPANDPVQTSVVALADGDGPTGRQRARWVLLAMVPSSLLLGVTTHITTDIAAAPLLWVIPLALYLLTFVIVFASKPLVTHTFMVRLQPAFVLILALTFALSLQVNKVFELMTLHLTAFFVITLVCHGEMAATRPAAKYLTEFYLWMSIGGLLGGIFNSLVAPAIFSTVLEYPLALVLACLVRSTLTPKAIVGETSTRANTWSPTNAKGMDFALPFALGAVLYGGATLILPWMNQDLKYVKLMIGLFLLGTVTCFFFHRRPVRFGLGIAGILLAGSVTKTGAEKVLHVERSFFGVHRVVKDGDYHRLSHGTTLHGAQSLDPKRQLEPLTYYHRTGPLGQVFATLSPRMPQGNIAVCGLGTGSIATYALPGQRWTFYEIDAVVKSIASDPRYFTFLRDCAAKEEVRIVLGDARLMLADEPDYQFDLLILDAFSSDAVPAHLISREALQLYLKKLKDDGVVVFHISNRFLDLTTVLGNLAEDAQLIAWTRFNVPTPDEESQLFTASQWVVLTRSSAVLDGIVANDRRWQRLPPDPKSRVWTDDFSNIFGTIKSSWAK